MPFSGCNNCVFIKKLAHTSELFKVLLTLKLLHGSRSGAKGSTLEDIAMHMIKHFSLDGDIKSQVLASLKYGVKMHFIQKKKDKFSLIMPASSVHLAPCKYKNEETERVHCIFPATWDANSCGGGTCSANDSCCGKCKQKRPRLCCQENSDESEEEDPCGACKRKKSRSSCGDSVCPKISQSQNSCNQCENMKNMKKMKKRRPPCAQTMPSACSRNKKKKGSNNPFDNYCVMCENGEDSDENCDSGFRPSASKNCSCCSK